jgi:hypothetical protein
MVGQASRHCASGSCDAARNVTQGRRHPESSTVVLVAKSMFTLDISGFHARFQGAAVTSPPVPKVILLATPKSGEKHPSLSRKNGVMWGKVATSSACDMKLIPMPMGFASRIESAGEPFFWVKSIPAHGSCRYKTCHRFQAFYRWVRLFTPSGFGFRQCSFTHRRRVLRTPCL